MKKIGLLTRDNAGINMGIRAVVRTALAHGIEVVGFYRGYQGLIDDDFINLDTRSVSGLVNRGGSMLKAARCKEFQTEEGLAKALNTIKKHDLDGLIVIGGNGSLAGAEALSQKGIKVIGVPSTIDNDVNGVSMTIGADTALNVAVDALDKIRDTAHSMERVFVVEVMGRDCGYIALHTALAAGCEDVIVPEKEFDCHKMCEDIAAGHEKGKISWIIIVAEGKAKAHDVAQAIRAEKGFEVREVVLGHVQRGGRPTAFDRILATRLSSYAVELLKDGASGVCVGLKSDKLISISLAEAIKPKDIEEEEYYKLIKMIT